MDDTLADDGDEAGALNRLALTGDGMVRYKLKRQWPKPG